MLDEVITLTQPPPLAHSGDYISEDDYWAYYYHDDTCCYEWNNGVLEEKPLSDLANSFIYRWFLHLLEEYLRHNPIATITVLDLGFKLKLPYKKTIRRPDLGIIRHDNPVQIAAHESTYKGIFDLCIESLSDSKWGEVERDTVTKKSEYEDIGVKEYYILDSKGRSAFFQRNAQGVYEPIKPVHGVIHSQILPGFRFRLVDLQQRPSWVAMSQDEVYRHFIWPEYQSQKSQIERLKAKLQELGISSDEV